MIHERRIAITLLAIVAAGLAGCGHKVRPATGAARAAYRDTRAAPVLPAGTTPDMAVPPRLTDGSYATPNRGLSVAGTVWHLRAALNVAALACRGPNEARMIAAYNGLLVRQKAALAAAEKALSAEYRASGGKWQDRYDDEMTRLYNFFSQAPARDGFCAAATTVLAYSPTVTPAALPTFAAARLPELERPFVQVYAAVEAWRAANPRAWASARASAGAVTYRAQPAARAAVRTSAAR